MDIQIIQDEQQWQTVLKDRSITDVYYQYGYVAPMAEHVGGTPVLLDCSDGERGFVLALIISDIAHEPYFRDVLPEGVYLDAESPYGYGGPLFYGKEPFSAACMKEMRAALLSYAEQNHLISLFLRFHPFHYSEGRSDLLMDRIASFKSTIYMDTADEETILRNLDGQYRRKIRKAREAGVTISNDGGERIDEFIRLYEATMDLHQAEPFYYFPRSYYDHLLGKMKESERFFYAELEGKIIAASLYLFDHQYMHFHLGGRDPEAPAIPFENLLMVEAALWAANHGCKALHLGGGLSDEDSLFQYKKKFHRGGAIPFRIGRIVFDQERYHELLSIRKREDPSFPDNNPFMIQYRYG